MQKSRTILRLSGIRIWRKGVGFEPTIRYNRIPISSPAHSTSLPSFQRRGILTQIGNLVNIPRYESHFVSGRRDFDAAHVGTEHFRNRHAAVGVLIVFKHRDERAADREAGAVQGVDILRAAVSSLKRVPMRRAWKASQLEQELISR